MTTVRSNPSRAGWLALSAAVHLALAAGFVRFAPHEPIQPVLKKTVAVSLVTLPSETKDHRSHRIEPAKRPGNHQTVKTASTISNIKETFPASLPPAALHSAGPSDGPVGSPWASIRIPHKTFIRHGPEKAGRIPSGAGSVSGRTDEAIPPGWLSEVRSRIERAKRYPWSARLRGLQGTSLVRFQVASNGAVRDVGILRSSAYKILDDAAVQTVERAAPFPSLPAELADNDIEINIPLVFELH